MNKGALVAYKQNPAIISEKGDKITITLSDGKKKLVREKDVISIHPGPVERLPSANSAVKGSEEEAWELLQGETPNFYIYTELVYGEFTPQNAWSAFKNLQNSLYFSGSTEGIVVHSKSEIEKKRGETSKKESGEEQKRLFLKKLKEGVWDREERHRFNEVEKVARSESSFSKLMGELKQQQNPESAHRFLIHHKVWDYYINPYPHRFKCARKPPNIAVPPLPDEKRLDLTYLESYAIDDEWSHDPDDAVSFEEGALWIHIADVAALAPFGSEIDRAAAERGTTLYLPEGKIDMLPLPFSEQMGLGLHTFSPAFSFRIELDERGFPQKLTPHISTIKVKRLTYEETDSLLKKEEEPFHTINLLLKKFNAYRVASGALSINMPDVKVSVTNKKVSIKPLDMTPSRLLVMEAMVMVGYAAARVATDNLLPFPFVQQPEPQGELKEGNDLATMYGNLRFMSRSRASTTPGPHSGLGLDCYARVTSPLRRYCDLLAQQQLRQFIKKEPLLSFDQIIEGVGNYEAAIEGAVKCDRNSHRHWKVVYLFENPQWEGEAVLVKVIDSLGVFLIPKLAMETRLPLKKRRSLNARVKLAVDSVDIPSLQVDFKLVEWL